MTKKQLNNSYIFDGKGILLLLAGMVCGSVVVATLNVVILYLFNYNMQYTDLYLILSNMAAFAGSIAAFDYFICRPSTHRPLNFNFSPTNLMTYVIIFPMMFGMMLIAESITAQIPISGPFFGEFYQYFSTLMEQMTRDPATLIVIAVIFAPLFEEIVFRGIIQKGLINKGWRPRYAILISALAFGLIHGNPWQFIGAILLGSVLGLVYYKTKSLLLPILLHAFNNLCSAILIFYGKSESFAEVFQIPEYIILAVGMVLFWTFYFLFTRRYRVHYQEN